MGSCQSQEIRAQNFNSRLIEKSIAKGDILDKKTIKLLLLGASESGKSTILKQIQIIHLQGFPDSEIEQRRPVIYTTVIATAMKLINATEKPEFQAEIQQDHEQIKQVRNASVSGEETVSRAVYNAIKVLLSDPVVQNLIKEESPIFGFNDREKYFLENVDRIMSDNYVPSNEDILRSRIATTGVSEIRFRARDTDFHVFDVGGQRSERKKWIHVFDNVDALIFVMALSEYDQLCVEDNSINRMIESLYLFSWICNHDLFKNTTMVFFFNKSDLFRDTVKRVPLKTVFPDFHGPNTYEKCLDYVMGKFKSQNKFADKKIFTHVTCATDTNQVKKVTTDVFKTIMKQNMMMSGV